MEKALKKRTRLQPYPSEKFDPATGYNLYPLTLHFPSLKERSRFMQGMVDGWGEGKYNVRWDPRKSFNETTEFNVDVPEFPGEPPGFEPDDDLGELEIEFGTTDE